jgi:hypothetical protein
MMCPQRATHATRSLFSPQALWAAQPAPSLPPNYAKYVGEYAGGALVVSVQNNTLVGGPYVFHEVEGTDNLLRVSMAAAPASSLACDLLASGPDGELAYASVDAAGNVVGVLFMGEFFPKTA